MRMGRTGRKREAPGKTDRDRRGKSDRRDKKSGPTRVRTPEVLQVEACECGAAALQIILRYHRCYLPMEQVRYECNVSRDGCNAADLVKAGRKFGMVAKGYRVGLARLSEVQVPCILHWKFNHFCVLEGIRGDRVYLNDPAVGRRRTTMEELDRSYTGIVLTFEPGEGFKTSGREHTMSAIFKRTVRGQKESFAYLLLAGLLLTVPGLAGPVLTQIFIDEVLLQSNVYWFAVILVAMGMVVLFQCLLVWTQQVVLARMKQKLIMLTDVRLVRHMLRLPVSFFEQRYPGELSQRVESNNDIYNFASGALSSVLLNIFEAVFYLIFLLFISPRLALVGIAGVAVNLVISFTTRRKLSELTIRQRQDQNHLIGVLCAGLSVFGTIKANGAENDYAGDITARYAGTTRSEQELGRMQQVLSAVPGAVTGVFNVLILLGGVRLVVRGMFTAGMLTAFMQILSSFTTPVNQLIGFERSIQTMRGDVSRVEDALGAREDARFEGERDDAPKGHLLSGQIEVRGVTFGYNPGRSPVIRDISFRATPGVRIGIVGASGCGKSTLGKVLAGLVTPWQGEVLYDGVSVFRVPEVTLNCSLSVIGQSTMFISGSVRENLLFWDGSYRDQDLLRAIRDAEAGELIAGLPGGLDYHLEEGAGNLSGGQRQQLEIARALVRDPSILIMDEATSALDAVTESMIMRNIQRRGCTCIIIAHRLSTIRTCDVILVLDRGRIAEAGTHEQLMQRGGLYARLEEN